MRCHREVYGASSQEWLRRTTIARGVCLEQLTASAAELTVTGWGPFWRQLLGCITTPPGHPQTHTPTRRTLCGCYSVPRTPLGCRKYWAMRPQHPEAPGVQIPAHLPPPSQRAARPGDAETGLRRPSHVPDLHRHLLPPTLPHLGEPLGTTPLQAPISRACTQTGKPSLSWLLNHMVTLKSRSSRDGVHP